MLKVNVIDTSILIQALYAAEYMRGSPLCWKITMRSEECERSQLSMEVIQRLERIYRE